MPDLFDERAHARRTDPHTSHEAAEAVTPNLRELQQRVLTYALKCGAEGFMDVQLEDHFDDSGSTMRTRRSELTDRNIIIDSGRRATYGGSARKRIVWVHRQFVPNAPSVCDPPVSVVMTSEDRARGTAIASELERCVDRLRGAGLIGISAAVAEAAAFIRRVS